MFDLQPKNKVSGNNDDNDSSVIRCRSEVWTKRCQRLIPEKNVRITDSRIIPRPVRPTKKWPQPL